MINILLLILFSAILVSLGQVFFKKGVAPLEPPNMRSLRSYQDFMRQVFQTRWIWLGFVTIGAGIVVWLIALAQADLSLAFPIDSVQYVVILLAARFFLGEKLNAMKLAGTFLVMAGIVLISVS